MAFLPAPPGPGVLRGVSCAAAADCTAVGDYFRAGTQFGFAEHWDGAAWTATPIASPRGATAAQLNSVSCPAAADCMAVGSDSTSHSEVALAEQWNGRTWSSLHVAGPPGQRYAPSTLTAVACRSASLCTAAGFFAGKAAVSRVLAERWNGRVWAGLPAVSPSGLDAELEGVACPARGGCTAVGDFSLHNTGIATLAEHGS